MDRFCAKCGKENVPLIKNLCIECYIKLNPHLVKIPLKIEIFICKRCGNILFGKKLLELNKENIEKIISKNIKTQDLEKVRFDIGFDFDVLLRRNETKVNIIVYGFIENILLKIKRSTMLKLKKKTCEICAKLAGGYHEAVLQLRGFDEEKYNEIKLFVFEQISKFANDPLARVVDIKLSKHGIDFLIGSNRAAKIIAENLAKIFKGKIKISTKLIGKSRDGKPKYKFTYCVRALNKSFS